MDCARITDNGEIVKKKGKLPAAHQNIGYRFMFKDNKNRFDMS
jgi:hypothetical protein